MIVIVNNLRRIHLRRYLSMALIMTCMSMVSVSSQAQELKAPDWTLNDAQGRDVSLSDYYGKPLILHFWASWCPYCKKLQPGLERLYQQYHADGLEVLGINWREDAGVQPQKVLERRGITFKTLVEGDAVADQYGVRGTPTTFFIDKEGVVVWVTIDSDPDNPGMEEVVRQMLEE